MSTGWLSLAALVYVGGLVILRHKRQGLVGYVWGAFGLAGLIILFGEAGTWNVPLGAVQIDALAWMGGLAGLGLTTLGPGTLVVPDPTGWSVLSVGIECSTLIESAVFIGLILFYPRFPAADRFMRLLLGLGGTLLVNLIRLSVIVGMVYLLGKPAVPWAHAVVARLVFFAGIVVIYWKLLTLPTLQMVRRDMEVSGRAVR
jgi:exosortase family protein XrtG